MTENGPPDRGPDRETAELSRLVSELTFEGVPERVVETLKASVLDTIGVALAATSEPGGAQEAVSLALEHGGRAESTVWPSARRLPFPAAVFANGALARALDFDDIYDSGPIHVGATIVPSALAAAERRTSPVSGEEFLAALAAAGEVLCRCGIAAAEVEPPGEAPPVLYSQLFGYFGAAAAAARVLGLTRHAIESAFGLALMQATGTMEIIASNRSGGKALYGAFSNQGGAQSALLAGRGVECRCAVFTGRAGLFGHHLAGELPPSFLDGLGEHFHLADLSFKPWPCTKVSHPFLEAALVLRGKGFATGAIDEVILDVGRWGRQFSGPADDRRYPASAPTAKNSLPYVVAVALARGDVGVADFQPEALTDATVRDIAGRTRIRFDPARSTALGYEAGRVEIRTRRGDLHAAEIDVPLGDGRRPMSSGTLAAKFRACVRVAGLDPHRAERCAELTSRLEELRDVRELANCISGFAAGSASRDRPSGPEFA